MLMRKSYIQKFFFYFAILLYISACDSAEEKQIANVDQSSMNMKDTDQMLNTTQVVGFRSIFENYLKPNCAQEACHGGERGIGNLSFSDVDRAYADLLNIAPTNAKANDAGYLRVKANDAEKSFLYTKMTLDNNALSAQGFGAMMPMSSVVAAGDNTKNIIKDWINAGAPLDGIESTDFDSVSINSEHYVSCDATDEEGMKSCFAAPQYPDQSVRIYTPVIEIPANTEVLICSYINVPLDQAIEVNQAIGQQMPGGHHIAVFLALAPSDEAPHPCRDDEMSNFRYTVGAGGGGGQDTQLPPGIAITIQPQQQFVIQSHYLNATDTPMKIMDAVDLVTIPKEEVTENVDPFAVIYSDLAIPANTMGFEISKMCRLEQDLNIYMLLGHTHNHGVLFEVYYHASDLAEPRKLYYATDGHLLKDNPEIKYFDPPLPFKAGDQIEVKCVWDNPTDQVLGWPDEMCVALMYYGPGGGWMTCDSADETPQVNGGDTQAEGCVDENAMGNDLGVGMACTVGGNECLSNSKAKLCLATFDSSANFCSFLGCQTDEDCGEGASCLMQSAANACVPYMCL